VTVIDLAVSPPPALRADVCVIGAGAAGITLALELERRGVDCLVLEGGGTGFEAASQELYDGWSRGAPYPALDTTRLRYLGGSTNHWGGWCRPLDPADLRSRPALGIDGWPLDPAALDDVGERALELCELGAPGWDASDWFARVGAEPLPTDPDRVTTEVFRFSPPTRFGERYRDELAAAAGTTVLLHADAVGLEGAGGAISGVRIVTPSGSPLVVSARRVVLAMGGIENARFLLHTDDDGRGAYGDRGGWVGRGFMEHLQHLWGADVLCDDAAADRLAAYLDFQATPDGIFYPALVTAPSWREAEGVGACSVTLADVTPLLDDRLPADTLPGVRELLRRYGTDEPTRLLSMFVRSEQLPVRTSRVRLGTVTDRLGLRRPVLEWWLQRSDLRTVERSIRVFGAELARLGLGRVHERYGSGAAWDGLVGASHHMGTTRMHERAEEGVVDADGRVHGTANLYVAGSSVFPTGGYANPTLTLVALACRLAAHLGDA
jgi:choline dehydrogenase-like flavoprotein